MVIGFAAASSQAIDAGSYGGYHYSNNDMKPEEVVMGVLGSIVAGVGIYALGSYMEWWGAPSNDELISQGRQYVAQASGYNGMYRIAQHSQLNNRVHEDSLYECAVLKRGSVNIHDYLSSLQGLISNLKKSAEKLGRRIDDIGRDRSSKHRHVLGVMRSVLDEVRTARRETEALYGYLNDHRSYFKLFEMEDFLAQKYAREIGVVQQYAYSEYDLAQAARTAMIARHTGAFGLIKAVNTLQSDIVSLERAMNGCAYHYANRIDCSRSLMLTLKRIQEVIVSDYEYSRMLAQYEAAEREKERLRLERERVANEQRIASAREREAYAKEREARAREEQNRLKHQENRLKEQELRDNRAQHNTYFYN